MATIEDLGKKVKAKFPGQYDDMADADLGKKVKAKYPDAYKDFTEKRPLFSGSTGEVAKKARVNLANLQGETTKANYEQDISNIKGKAVGEAAAMAPFAAAAPFTGGASLGVGLTLMGAAGLVGGTARETAKALLGSTEMPESGKVLALGLGLDAGLGMAGEGTGRAISSVGLTLIPKLIQRSAAKAEAGKMVLDQAFGDARNALYEIVGKTPVNVGPMLNDAYQALGKLPKGAGSMGKRFSGPTGPASEILGALEADLGLAGGKIAADQPLDALVRMKGSLSQMAFKESGLNTEERLIVKQLVTKLDKTLKEEMKPIGPVAEALYKKANDLMIVQKERSAAVQMAERAMKTMVGRAMAGGLMGGGVGMYKSRGLTGAAEGAALGALAGATSTLPPKLATLILEQTMSHPEAAPLYRKAIKFFVEGSEGPAVALATRAMLLAGARDTIKAAKEAPDAAQAVQK